jgi:hypothetical protein
MIVPAAMNVNEVGFLFSKYAADALFACHNVYVGIVTHDIDYAEKFI